MSWHFPEYYILHGTIMMIESSTLTFLLEKEKNGWRKSCAQSMLSSNQGPVKCSWTEQLFQFSFGSFSFDFPFFCLMKQKHEQQGSCNKNFISLFFSHHKCYWKSLCIYEGFLPLICILSFIYFFLLWFYSYSLQIRRCLS